MKTELPQYVCSVHALKIETILPGDPITFLVPSNPAYDAIEVTAEWVKRHVPVAPGYLVVYEDGYTSWSPVGTFERGYTLV